MADVVTYTAAFTRNMGNYESLKLGLGFSTDLRDGETEADAMARAKTFVGGLLLAEVDEVESDLRGISTAAQSRAAKK